MVQGSRDATVLVGMPRFAVGATEVIDGELWLRAETTADVAERAIEWSGANARPLRCRRADI